MTNVTNIFYYGSHIIFYSLKSGQIFKISSDISSILRYYKVHLFPISEIKMDRPSAAERKEKRRALQSEVKKLEDRVKAKNGMKVLKLKRKDNKILKKREAKASKQGMRKMREKKKSESSLSQQPEHIQHHNH